MKSHIWHSVAINIPFLLTLVLLFPLEPPQTLLFPHTNLNIALQIFNRKECLHVKFQKQLQY